ATETSTRVPLDDAVVEGLYFGQAVWSPAGDRIAVSWEGKAAGGGGVPAPGGIGAPGGGGADQTKRIRGLDGRGENAKTIRVARGDLYADEHVITIEWAAPRIGELPKDEKK